MTTPTETHAGAWRGLWRILSHFDRSKIVPWQALRNTAGVVLPLIVGYAIGMPRGGLAVASGALNVSYSDGHDPYAQRMKRMLSSSVWCAIGVFTGALTGRHNEVAVLAATVWAFVAGMLVSLGTTAADVGVISCVTLIVYAAQPLTPRQAVEAGLLALAGGVLQTSLSVALWPVRRYEPERRALAALFQRLAEAARQPLEAAAAPPASLESTRAQEALSGLKSDTTLEGVRYRSLLSQAERIRLSLMMLARLRLRMSRESKEHHALEVLDKYLDNAVTMLQAIAQRLETNQPAGKESDRWVLGVALAYQLREENAGAPGTFFNAVLQDARYQMDALSGQLRAAIELAEHASPEGQAEFDRREAQQPWWLRFTGRLATLRANLNLQSIVFRHAIRLAICIAVGNALGRSFDWRRSYWIPMTIVLVLKPEFTTTFSRGLLRISGTIAGLILATALFHFLPITIASQIALIAVFTFLVRWIGPANYGVFGIAISALIVFLLAIVGAPPKQVILARGLNTAAGGALALLAYLAWPTWERTRVPEFFAQLLDAYRASFHAISESYLSPQSVSPRELDRARVNARVARSNLEASLDRLSAEPGTTADQASRFNAMLASSHRFAHAMMALEAGVSRTQIAPARSEFRVFATDAERMLESLANVFRGKRVSSKQWPDLRADHTKLLQSGHADVDRYALVNIEADRITNSLNTLREQVESWTGAGAKQA